MSNTIKIDVLRRQKKSPDKANAPCPAQANTRPRRSPDSFIILIDDNKTESPADSGERKDAARRHPAKR